MKNLSSITQKIQNIPIIQKLYKCANRYEVNLFLVGGSVRDLFLNRSLTDFDFTLKSDAVDFAKKFANYINAPFIPLEENPPIARVIIRTEKSTNTEISLDFAQFRAATLVEDLNLRDLTINALAIPLYSIFESDTLEVIDESGGMTDLESQKLQFLSEKVLVDDPLRLIRIFRFAGQLDFSITQESLGLVKQHAHKLPNVSAERIRDELMKLLNTKNTSKHLTQMYQIGLLPYVCSAFRDRKIDWNYLENFEDCPIPSGLNDFHSDIENYLNVDLGLFANKRSLIKLSLLLQSDMGEIQKQLLLSRRATQFVKTLFNGHIQLCEKDLNKNQIVDFLRYVGDEWWGVLLYSNIIKPISLTKIEEIVDIYFNHLSPILKQDRLITGDDLIHRYGMKPGKEIGRLLNEIEKLRFYGEIRTREEAYVTVENMLSKEKENL